MRVHLPGVCHIVGVHQHQQRIQLQLAQLPVQLAEVRSEVAVVDLASRMPLHGLKHAESFGLRFAAEKGLVNSKFCTSKGA